MPHGIIPEIHSVAPAPLCAHCGQIVPLARRSVPGAAPFCCAGCEAVYELLTRSGLSRYYQLREQSTAVRPGLPATAAPAERFSFLDEPELRSEIGIRASDPELECFLEGVHCTACVWLIESLPRLSEEVREARLDLGRATVRLRLRPGGKFAGVCELLVKLGYVPHPLLRDDQAGALEKKEDRRMLLRLAIAGAAAGNVMLFSIGLYAGVEGGLAALFRWLSILVALPAFAWSALPFYRGAWGSLRARRLSIDAPIALALIGGYVASVVAVFRGDNDLYLDSLTGLIFLLLSTRYILRRLQRTRLDAAGLFRVLAPATASRLAPGGRERVPVERLRAGDRIEAAPDEVLPADGTIEQGTSRLDRAVLTGESAPQAVGPGDAVFAGTRNLDAPITVKLSGEARQSRLGQIADAIARSPRIAPRSVRTADRAAQAFVLATFALAIGVILYFWGSAPAEGFRRALCLIVVACPCALALATPLALARAYRLAAESGALLKNPEQIDTLADIRAVFLDKTGTLTRGAPMVHQWVWLDSAGVDRDRVLSAVYSIESESRHPIALALCEFLGNRNGVRLSPVTGFRETPGSGVIGDVDGLTLSITRLAECPADGATWIGITSRGQLLARVGLRDELRADSEAVLERLRRRGTVTLLSGDGRAAVASLADRLSLPARWEISPEEKARLVGATPHAMMVGDGANDALALSRAEVGVAVQGSLDVSVRAADIVLLRPGLAPVRRLLTIADETRRVLYRNYAFSIAYNALGAYLALRGSIGPLFAAVVMPLSALTVFLSSSIGTAKLRRPL